jgi:PAS domain-containing protein
VTRQNRVLPTGEIVALPFRGAWMGNRGILHDEAGRLGRATWRHPHWIICRLQFKGRRRPIMAPRRYTELFFFDEAVALAAGHRPCAECRRDAFNAYRAAWAKAHACSPPSAAGIDDALHAARIDRRDRRQATYRATLGTLPDGVFVRDAGGTPSLLWNGLLHPYLGAGYGPPESSASSADFEVLTPAPSVRALLAGYPVSVRLDR